MPRACPVGALRSQLIDATGLSRGASRWQLIDATGLSRGASRWQLYTSLAPSFRCHGLVPWHPNSERRDVFSSEREPSTGQARGIQTRSEGTCLAANVNPPRDKSVASKSERRDVF